MWRRALAGKRERKVLRKTVEKLFNGRRKRHRRSKPREEEGEEIRDGKEEVAG
jgi:hypothetical protein